MFRILKKSIKSKARAGILRTRRGSIQTPFFMPIATKGAVKSLTGDDLRNLKTQIILSNTYHQLLRPGLAILKKAGGLHSFMDWHGPLLTDSGGFQVFSLAKIRKILPNGVKFRSHIDGKEFLLTPKGALDIQEAIGSDIRMILDVCPPYPCSRKEAERAVELTTKWAQQSAPSCIQEGVRGWLRDNCAGGLPPPNPLLSKGGGILFFAIIQGSTHKDLRLKSARELIELGFDGYAIGGLAVGEPAKEMYKVLEQVIPSLPANKPHHLMGVGKPEQIVAAVERGIDMFDCVIPTREARHGRLYLFRHLELGRLRRPGVLASVEGSTALNTKTFRPPRADQGDDKSFYEAINITNKKFARDLKPINANSKIPELRVYTKAYLNHLFKTQEPLAQRLATLNNVEFYLELMARIRQGIRRGEV